MIIEGYINVKCSFLAIDSAYCELPFAALAHVVSTQKQPLAKHFLTAEAILADARLNLYIISHRIGPSCVSVQNKILVIRTYWAYFCSKVFLMGLFWRAYYIPEGILSERIFASQTLGSGLFSRGRIFWGGEEEAYRNFRTFSFFFRCLLCPLNFNKRKVKIHTPMIVNEF